MTTMVMMRGASTAGFGTLLVACGGGGGSNGDFGGFPAYTVAELPFTVDGSEAELNLANPDAVLTAALSAAAAANAILASQPGQPRHRLQSPRPGRASLCCRYGPGNRCRGCGIGSAHGHPGLQPVLRRQRRQRSERCRATRLPSAERRSGFWNADLRSQPGVLHLQPARWRERRLQLPSGPWQFHLPR